GTRNENRISVVVKQAPARANRSREREARNPCFCRPRRLVCRGTRRFARAGRRDGGNSMGGLSIWHWIVVIAVLLLLFGRGKISELMGDVAQGIKAFKKGMQEEDKTAESKNSEPAKTIEHQPAETVAQTESRKAS